jgi:hypothetical protein
MRWSYVLAAALLMVPPRLAVAQDWTESRIVTPGGEVTETVQHGVTILAPAPRVPTPAPQVARTIVPVPVIVPVPQQQAASPPAAPRPSAPEAGGPRRGLGAYVR